MVGYYFANKAYIAEVLCINKDKAAMQCDGKCYLKQKMQAADEPVKQHQVSIKYEPVEFITGKDLMVHFSALLSSKAFVDSYQANDLMGHASLVFQPPC